MTKKAPPANTLAEEKKVIEYLSQTPDFFERHPAVLTSLMLPNPHGEGVVSLTHKQLHLLREELKRSDIFIETMLDNGKENDAINHRMHAFSLALLAANNLNALSNAIEQHLKTPFSLTQASLCLLKQPHAKQLPSAFLHWLANNTLPYCDTENSMIKAMVESNHIQPHHASFCLVPLINTTSGEASGALILASNNPHHFSPEMDTDFLQRVGELLSAALHKMSD